jgi:hypothetical protein
VERRTSTRPAAVMEKNKVRRAAPEEAEAPADTRRHCLARSGGESICIDADLDLLHRGYHESEGAWRAWEMAGRTICGLRGTDVVWFF